MKSREEVKKAFKHFLQINQYSKICLNCRTIVSSNSTHNCDNVMNNMMNNMKLEDDKKDRNDDLRETEENYSKNLSEEKSESTAIEKATKISNLEKENMSEKDSNQMTNENSIMEAEIQETDSIRPRIKEIDQYYELNKCEVALDKFSRMEKELFEEYVNENGGCLTEDEKLIKITIEQNAKYNSTKILSNLEDNEDFKKWRKSMEKSFLARSIKMQELYLKKYSKLNIAQETLNLLISQGEDFRSWGIPIGSKYVYPYADLKLTWIMDIKHRLKRIRKTF